MGNPSGHWIRDITTPRPAARRIEVFGYSRYVIESKFLARKKEVCSMHQKMPWIIAFITTLTLVVFCPGQSRGQDYEPPDPVYPLPTFAVHPTAVATQREVVVVKSEQSSSDAVFRELFAGLSKDVKRPKAAQVLLEYWHESERVLPCSSVRKPVMTKDGKAAEVVFLTGPPGPIPGNDFSVAFLLVDKRVIDWASCWTCNRTAHQELLLEDVDGDDFLDVAFRASEGWFGLRDKRQHSRPGDKRKWLYAYAITSTGCQSLFTCVDRELKVKLSYDTAHQPVKLEIKGLPESLRVQRMVECTFLATNTSKKDLPIAGQWFKFGIEKAGYTMVYGPIDNRPVVEPGETISQVVRLIMMEADEALKEVTLRLSFVPPWSVSSSP